MTLEEMWQGVRRGYSRVNALLGKFYRHGPICHAPDARYVTRSLTLPGLSIPLP